MIDFKTRDRVDSDVKEIFIRLEETASAFNNCFILGEAVTGGMILMQSENLNEPHILMMLERLKQALIREEVKKND